MSPPPRSTPPILKSILSLRQCVIARHRRRHDLRRLRGDGDRRWNAPEHEKRRQDEPAAHAEHARQEPHGRPEADDEEYVHRHLGDGQINLHGTTAVRVDRDARGDVPTLNPRRSVWLAHGVTTVNIRRGMTWARA